ncbi:MAG: hypothetical protein ACKPKO_20225 [Candidatus Fonsibacter sp.]
MVSMEWINKCSKMTLNTTGLTVVGTITPSSDKRMKFNENQ